MFNPYKSSIIFNETYANSANPDQTPQVTASGQVSSYCLHNVLLKYCEINIPKIGNWLVLLIKVAQSIQIKWVNKYYLTFRLLLKRQL